MNSVSSSVVSSKMKAAFLDFATLGPGVNTASLDKLLQVSYHTSSNHAEILERLHDKEVALLNKAFLDRDIITTSGELKLIVLAATGTDNVDLAVAKKRGIAVSNIRDYCTDAVAQHVMALILGLTRQVGGCRALVSAEAWPSKKPAQIPEATWQVHKQVYSQWIDEQHTALVAAAAKAA